MKRIITLNKTPVVYTLRKNRRARLLRLSVHADGNISVSAPYHLGITAIEKFVAEKADWIISKIEYFKKHGAPVIQRNTRKEYLLHKSAALKLARAKIKQFNEFYNFKINKVTIKNVKTRWGSCSKSGNLNFNYKIALLPEYQADYIVVHELCHLKEFNHSARFWTLVAKTVPGYEAIRRELRNKKI